MDKVQTRIVKEIMNNKEVYLDMAGDKRDTLSDYYDQLSSLMSKYRLNLLDKAISLAGYNKALKTHKVDPYLAGGAAQGLAGVGVGVVTALNVEGRNQKIDSMRAEYKERVFRDSVNTSGSERKVLDLVKIMDELLDSVESIKEYRDQEIEKEYQDAKKYMNKGSVIVYEQFLSLGDYKDSALLARKTKQANDASLVHGVIKISLIVAAFFALLGFITGVLVGDLAKAFVNAFGMGFGAFVPCSVMLGVIAWMNRIKE